jgi:hypothetical protein
MHYSIVDDYNTTYLESWHESGALLLPVVQRGGRRDNEKWTPGLLMLQIYKYIIATTT